MRLLPLGDDPPVIQTRARQGQDQAAKRQQAAKRE